MKAIPFHDLIEKVQQKVKLNRHLIFFLHKRDASPEP